MPVAARRTSGRSDGSFQLRPRSRVRVQSPGGGGQTRLTSPFVAAIVGASVLGGLVAVTPPGKIITAAVLHFLLFYGGVFALIAMTTAVGIGLVATDRIIMSPGRRVTAQAVHRAVALAALAFLVIHILLEIVAARSQVADAVVPFLARKRGFYIGLGTIASDMILVIVASGFLRHRFIAFSRPWAWRSVHVSAYLAWVLSIVHGLLGGRAAKPYVDWSYGACVAAVALALAVRLVATSRSREEVALAATGPGAERGGWQQPWPPALTQAGPAMGMLSLPAGTSGLAAGSVGLPAGTPGLPAGTSGLPAQRLGLPGDTSRLSSDITAPQRAIRTDAGLPAEPLPAGTLLDGARPAMRGEPAPAGSTWDALRPTALRGEPVPARPAVDDLRGHVVREEPVPARPAWDDLRGPAVREDPVPARPAWDDLRGPAVREEPVPARQAWDDPRPQPLRDEPAPEGSPWDALRPTGLRGGPAPARSPWDDLRSPVLREEPLPARSQWDDPRPPAPRGDPRPAPSPWDGLRPPARRGDPVPGRSPWDDLRSPVLREDPLPARSQWDDLRPPAPRGDPRPAPSPWDALRDDSVQAQSPWDLRPPASPPPPEPRWEAFQPPRRARHAAPAAGYDVPAGPRPGPADQRYDMEDDHPTGPLPRRVPRDIRSYNWPPR